MACQSGPAFFAWQPAAESIKKQGLTAPSPRRAGRAIFHEKDRI
jgi:hypothetical protein